MLKIVGTLLILLTLNSCAMFGGRKEKVQIETGGYRVNKEICISSYYHTYDSLNNGKEEIKDRFLRNKNSNSSDELYRKRLLETIVNSKIFSKFNFENINCKDSLEFNLFLLTPVNRWVERILVVGNIITLGLIPYRLKMKFRLEAKFLIDGKTLKYQVEDESVYWQHLIFLPLLFTDKSFDLKMNAARKILDHMMHMTDEVLVMIAKDLPRFDPSSVNKLK